MKKNSAAQPGKIATAKSRKNITEETPGAMPPVAVDKKSKNNPVVDKKTPSRPPKEDPKPQTTPEENEKSAADKKTNSRKSVLFLEAQHEDIKLALSVYQAISHGHISMGDFLYSMAMIGFESSSPDGYMLYNKMKSKVSSMRKKRRSKRPAKNNIQ